MLSKRNSARTGNPVALIVAVFLLLSCLFACMPTPRATVGVPAPDPASLLASLEKQKNDITSFRGIGKLTFTVNGERHTTRVAWIGSRPQDLRLQTLGLWGQPDLTFLIRGSTFCLHAHQENRCFKGKATPRNLSRFVSIPVGAEDLFALLSGQVPVLSSYRAKIRYSNGEDQWCLCLYNR